MTWIPLVTFLVHVAEEYPGFPAWATKHFGVTSRAWYVYSHIVLVAALVALSVLASSAAPGSALLWIMVAIQWTLATNAVFHLATTWRFREYSPGVVSGTLLFLPATVYTLRRVVREELLTTPQLAAALAVGSALGACVVASLYLRMDVDWRLRRETPGNGTKVMRLKEKDD